MLPILIKTMKNPDATPTRLVGELRAAVHDINNALTPILANAQIARLMVEDDGEELAEILDDVVDGAARASDLVVGMRGITRSLQEAFPPARGDTECLEEQTSGDSPGY